LHGHRDPLRKAERTISGAVFEGKGIFSVVQFVILKGIFILIYF
jgi:hypothetical protein